MTEPAVEIGERISSNKSRDTRLVYRGHCDGRPAIIKAFSHPSRGWLHWRRCDFNARMIRRRGIPAPVIYYSGWLSQPGAWVIIYELLEQAREFRWIKQAPDADARTRGLEQLVALFAHMHEKGTIQADTTLGNFLQQEDQVYVVDEDRIKIRPWPLGQRAAMKSLASVLTQIPVEDPEEIRHLYHFYCKQRDWEPGDKGARRLEKNMQWFREWRKNKKLFRIKKTALIAALPIIIIFTVIFSVI